jgi:hypothetical protein
MGDKALDMITGQANSGVQQFLQVVATGTVATVDFWSFATVNDEDAVLSQLTNIDNTDALGYLGAGFTAYKNTLYTGRFKAIKLTSGAVILHLSEQ